MGFIIAFLIILGLLDFFDERTDWGLLKTLAFLAFMFVLVVSGLLLYVIS